MGEQAMATATAPPAPDKKEIQKEALQKSNEVLGRFPHLTNSGPRMVSIADIADNDLSIENNEGTNIKDQDYVKDESKSTKEKAVVVRLDDSEATIKSIVENKAVWVPIHVTPRTPTKTQPQPYKMIDGRTRREGARKAGLHDVPTIVWEGFSAEKAQRQAEKAKDEDDSKDQTSGAQMLTSCDLSARRNF